MTTDPRPLADLINDLFRAANGRSTLDALRDLPQTSPGWTPLPSTIVPEASR